jgi:phytanoyl-CoA dioxygenase PhyH
VLPAVRKRIAITDAQRARLGSQGLLAIPGALAPGLVGRLTNAIDRVYAEEGAQGRLDDADAMHLLGGIGRDDAFLELLDPPAVFPVIWGELGWNVHVYHCHLDVTPPRRSPREPPAWGWHQDGGRLNLELDGDPRPRMSLKVVYWLSDLSAPGRGNMLVLPRSHGRNTLPRPQHPELGLRQPVGAEPVLASAGDALVFDRRLWHSRSDNLSQVTRKAIFLAYTYRWIRPRDDFDIDPAGASFRSLSPIRRQLLGEGANHHAFWGLGEVQVPVREELDRQGLLDPAVPSHR